MPIDYDQGETKGLLFVPGKRRRLNGLAVTLNILLPWLLFTTTFAILSFGFNYHNPFLAHVLALAGFAGAGLFWFLGWRNRSKKQDSSDRNAQLRQEGMWYTFTAIAFFVATVFGTICGDLNYQYNMGIYYDLTNLNSYPTVDTNHDRGQQLMDAGRVYFADGTALDLRKAMSFKEVDQYCVTPITTGLMQPPSYDFWAVGVNCCNGPGSSFQCGEYNNPYARSGLRLVHDYERQFFRLAVQQAEAQYNIIAKHPLFFYWMQDPVMEINRYRDTGYKFYTIGVLIHFVLNLFSVVAATVAFSKIGENRMY